MTPRRKVFWLAVIALVAAGFGIVLHDRSAAGPVYDGAPLDVWLKLLDDPMPQTRDKACDRIRRIGPAAVPLVKEWLDWKDSPLRRLLSAFVAVDENHTGYHPLTPKDRRRLALHACDVLGPVAQPAIPKLVTIATGPHPELDAPFLIARLGGSNAAPALARTLSSTNKFIRAAAGVSLDLLRSHAPDLERDRAVPFAGQDYERRLDKFHQLVMEAITSDRVFGATNQPAVR